MLSATHSAHRQEPESKSDQDCARHSLLPNYEPGSTGQEPTKTTGGKTDPALHHQRHKLHQNAEHDQLLRNRTRQRIDELRKEGEEKNQPLRIGQARDHSVSDGDAGRSSKVRSIR